MPREGFGEDCGKLLFYKILKGIQGCHEAGVYHLDIKIENIVVDQNYEPKICDFGLAKNKQGKLKCPRGTLAYKPPQLIEKKEYTGEKADIFYLGALLFFEVVGMPCFQSAKKDDFFYSQIVDHNINEFFKRVEKALQLNDEAIKSFNIVRKLTQPFKDLLGSMLDYEEEKRPKIEEILKNKWLNALKNNEIKNKLEEDLKNKFIEKEKIVIKYIQDNPNYTIKEKEDTFNGNSRGINNSFEVEDFSSGFNSKKKKY